MADKDRFGFSDKAYGKALADAAKKGGDGKGKAFQKRPRKVNEQKFLGGQLKDVRISWAQ